MTGIAATGLPALVTKSPYVGATIGIVAGISVLAKEKCAYPSSYIMQKAIKFHHEL